MPRDLRDIHRSEGGAGTDQGGEEQGLRDQCLRSGCRKEKNENTEMEEIMKKDFLNALYILLTGLLLVVLATMRARADEPKQIINGEYVIAEIHTQDNAIDITEPPTHSNTFNTLEALDALDDALETAPPINRLSEALDVYVPDSDDDCPVNDAVPLSTELQEYIWTRCKKATSDYESYYAFILGCIQHESTFRAGATHHNSNGSVDRGIMQINSSNIGKMKRAGLITSSEDLFDPFKCIDCGLWLMNQYIDKFGVSESAYYAYNTGRETEGSNKNSRKVMGYMAEWKQLLF